MPETDRRTKLVAFIPAGTLKSMNIDFERSRFNMIEQQIRPWDVSNPQVREALAFVKREDYVPAAHRELAFADTALPLAHGEFMMKPVVEGRMLHALAVDSSDQVLEVGTGSGYITACLGHLAREVLSVEIHDDLAERARRQLFSNRVTNVRVMTADALGSFDPKREFDAIVLTGAVYREPEKFRHWLKLGGRLFLICGESPAMEARLVTRLTHDRFSEESLFETDLPYLMNAAPPKRFVL